MSDSREDSFTEFFRVATHRYAPYGWQIRVAVDGLPDVLPVPTGLGKTEVVLAWAWRLLVDKQPEPQHLVVCLPTRSLVTQTVRRLMGYFDALMAEDPELEVGVYQLMGGAIDEEWARWPDKPWILVGTQDQLLSRALNRGYAMSRFEWPVHFGLLNHDCRWLIDEVQLMGPGLWTTVQLDWMRRKRFPSLKPCLTTWMSATIGTSFLNTTDRAREGLGEPSSEQAAFETKLKASLDADMGFSWWREAKRLVQWWKPDQPSKTGKATKSESAKSSMAGTVAPDAIAHAVVREHQEGTLSLVICNTVDMARDVFRALSATHKVLLTSRFRRADRSLHEQRLLDFDANRNAGKLPENDPGLICVSTQVIEAGVDISAHRLWSELPPWPSMLQRLGRLNRKGDDQDARAWFWETPPEKGGGTERIGPYESADIARAKRLVDAFAPLSRAKSFAEAIDELNTKCQKLVHEALQPKPSPLPRALDVHGLFSTERDVHGGFTDVSAFVRGTDPDLDVTVFWRDWSGDRPPRGDDLDGPLLEPAKEGCPVAFVRVQQMLESSKGKAWLWDDEADRWERVNPRDIRPGMLVMLKRDVGGYDTTEGWTGDKANVLSDVPRVGRGETLRDDSWTDIGYWSRLDVHLADACHEAESLCDRLGFNSDSPYRKALVEGAKMHDIGKAYPPWQDALPDRSGMPGVLLAKTPHVLFVDVDAASRVAMVCRWIRAHHSGALRLTDRDWRRDRAKGTRIRWAVDQKLRQDDLDAVRALRGVCRAGHQQFRPGLRHEAASALALWKRYRDDATGHPALAVYLVATHHGKVRTVLRSTTPMESDDVFGVRREADALEIGDQRWPMDFSVAKDGAEGRWEGNEFVLTGHGWTGLVADLLGPWRPEERSNAGVVPTSEPRHLGPFALAYLEALIRVVDWRASESPSESAKPSEVRRGD
jgi:CRISPR-associated endonuclease/helicase Cas3